MWASSGLLLLCVGERVETVVQISVEHNGLSWNRIECYIQYERNPAGKRSLPALVTNSLLPSQSCQWRCLLKTELFAFRLLNSLFYQLLSGRLLTNRPEIGGLAGAAALKSAGQAHQASTPPGPTLKLPY